MNATDLTDLVVARPLVKDALAAMASIAERLEKQETALVSRGLLKSAAMAKHRETQLSVAGACEALSAIGERLEAIERETRSFFAEPPQAAILALFQIPEGARLH
jgi:hypothetical protein